MNTSPATITYPDPAVCHNHRDPWCAMCNDTRGYLCPNHYRQPCIDCNPDPANHT